MDSTSNSDTAIGDTDLNAIKQMIEDDELVIVDCIADLERTASMTAGPMTSLASSAVDSVDNYWDGNEDFRSDNASKLHFSDSEIFQWPATWKCERERDRPDSDYPEPFELRKAYLADSLKESKRMTSLGIHVGIHVCPDESQLYARQYPNPNSEYDEISKKTIIPLLAKRPPDRKFNTAPMVYATLDEVEKFKEQGYKVWKPLGRPGEDERDPTKFDADRRNCLPVRDVYNTENNNQPHKDTAKLFSTGLAIWRRTQTAEELENWKLGDPVLSDSDVINAQKCGKSVSLYQAPSGSSDYINTASASDSIDVVSRGFRLSPSCLPYAGLNWGGHDQFHEWRAAGRSVDASMMKELKQQKWREINSPFTMVRDGDPTITYQFHGPFFRKPRQSRNRNRYNSVW
jgi:hypothetical protein